MKCANCQATLSCGCQRRIASNGVSVCSTCIALYEKELVNKRATLVNPGLIRPK